MYNDSADDVVVEQCNRIGLEKRDYMGLIFGPDDLDAQARLREVFDPRGTCNPYKVLPAGSRCGDLQQVPEGVWI